MRYLYTFLFYLILPFLFLRLVWRSRRAPLYRQFWAERLGFCSFQLETSIWVHAVSLGETIAAIPLIRALKEAYPTIPILVTNMTPTGRARVEAAFADSVFNAYIPYDLPDCLARFLKKINPRILIVMETELWPNLFAACKKRHIPIVVTNARLSAKSAKGYKKISALTREIFSAITILAVQAQADANRFIELGMPVTRVHPTGSLKFDLELPSDLEKKGAALHHELGMTRLIWLAASTHPGEEEIMLDAHQLIRARFPTALLILVPRHPERFDFVANLIAEKEMRMVRRTQHVLCDDNTVVYLADTMGEMLLLFSACYVACVAGSFVPIGGHNVIEPAALSKPILTGPYLFNFAEITHFMLDAGGMIKVQNATELAQQVLKFFEDPAYRESVGKNAHAVVEKNRGALRRQLYLIETLLNEK